jgi:hypothetical protein
MKKVSTLVGIIIIIAVAVILFGGVFAYQYILKSQQNSNFFASSQKTNQTQTVGWKTYKNNVVEIKYPNNWKIGQNYIIVGDSNLVFCPENLSDNSETVCKMIAEGTNNAPSYVKGLIFLYVYDSVENINNPSYKYLGAKDGKYYYLWDNFDSNKDVFNKMVSTFKFTK